MNTTTQCGAISDFLDAETITIFVRRSGTLGGVTTFMASQLGGTNLRSWGLSSADVDTSKISVRRSSDGTTANQEIYDGATGGITTADRCYVASWVNGGSRLAFRNNTSETLTIRGVTSVSSRVNSNSEIMLNSAGTSASPGSFMGGTYINYTIIRGTLTTTQREAITNFINAL